jgi:hypothetical protein
MSPDFDALAATFALDRQDLAIGRTILPGTLLARAPGSSDRVVARAPAVPVVRKELELLSVLGRGGMGVVWAAQQHALERVVAVKRLGEPPFGVRDATALLAEARATGALEHPAIVPVHDLGIDADGSPLLVMKRVEGATLTTLVDDPAHPTWRDLEHRHGDRLAAILDVLMRICDALELAHGRGFVHRDVKCDNVMVGAFGEVYLLDWGVALRQADASDAVEIVGTPSSMAPEMVRGDARAIDARSDVYLLGATLHQALTGRPRHEGRTVHAVLLAAFLSEPPVLDGIPDELASLVCRATAPDPSARPSSAARFREELAGFLRHRASTRLADDAITRLDGLDGADLARLASLAANRALTEARFALTQALREWPENARAASALEHALELCVRAELGRDSPGAAATLLGEMRAPSPALVAEVRAAEVHASERASLAATAIAEAGERDASRGAAIRRVMAGVFVVVAVVFASTVFLFGGSNPGARVGYGTAFAMDVAFLVASLVLLYATRTRTLVNRWNRDAVGLFLVAAVGTSLSHGIGWLRNDDIALRGDSPTQVVFAVVFGVGSLLLSRRLLLPSLVACLAAIVSAIWPASSLLASAVTVMTGAVTLAWTSRAPR